MKISTSTLKVCLVSTLLAETEKDRKCRINFIVDLYCVSVWLPQKAYLGIPVKQNPSTFINLAKKPILEVSFN